MAYWGQDPATMSYGKCIAYKTKPTINPEAWWLKEKEQYQRAMEALCNKRYDEAVARFYILRKESTNSQVSAEAKAHFDNQYMRTSTAFKKRFEKLHPAMGKALRYYGHLIGDQPKGYKVDPSELPWLGRYLWDVPPTPEELEGQKEGEPQVQVIRVEPRKRPRTDILADPKKKKYALWGAVGLGVLLLVRG